MPERLTSNRKVIGTKQLRKALKAGRVQTAYVASDAGPILREPLVEQCRAEGAAVGAHAEQSGGKRYHDEGTPKRISQYENMKHIRHQQGDRYGRGTGQQIGDPQ